MNQRILTAHQIAVADYRPCPLVRRLAAMIYDGLLIAALWMVATTVIVITAGSGVQAGNASYQLFLLIVAWAYLAICWRNGGQTLGMRAWRIGLAHSERRLPWHRTMVRFAVAALSLACAGLGFAWSLFRADRATWHDLASHTRLVDLRSQPAQQQPPEEAE